MSELPSVFCKQHVELEQKIRDKFIGLEFDFLDQTYHNVCDLEAELEDYQDDESEWQDCAGLERKEAIRRNRGLVSHLVRTRCDGTSFDGSGRTNVGVMWDIKTTAMTPEGRVPIEVMPFLSAYHDSLLVGDSNCVWFIRTREGRECVMTCEQLIVALKRCMLPVARNGHRKSDAEIMFQLNYNTYQIKRLGWNCDILQQHKVSQTASGDPFFVFDIIDCEAPTIDGWFLGLEKTVANELSAHI